MISLPTWLVAIIIAIVVLALVGVWASLTAARLNRLHIRTDSARMKLEGALHARAAAIGALDPKLAGHAMKVSAVPLKATDMGAHSEAENRLLAQLSTSVLNSPSFIDASARVDLAARFYNDAVGDTRELRSRRGIRLLRLAGFAPLPEYYEAAEIEHVH